MSIDSGPTPSPIDRTLRVPAVDARHDGATAPAASPDSTIPVARANVASPVASLPIASLIDGRYRVEGELGHGGMGVVYLARDASLDRLVALKMIAPCWEGDPRMSSRFHREAKALAAIRSSYVVQIHDFGLHRGQYFFAMEYVQGRTLRGCPRRVAGGTTTASRSTARSPSWGGSRLASGRCTRPGSCTAT